MNRLLPGKPVPDLQVKVIDGDDWDIGSRNPENFIMVVFYRGVHCPICRKQLTEINSRYKEFMRQGVDPIAISCDSEDRARRAKTEWNLEELPVGYGLSIETARKWGLYISKAIKDVEPDIFSEPGLFLVKTDGTLYSSIISTMPFVRPPTKELLRSIIGIKKSGYPARGESA